MGEGEKKRFSDVALDDHPFRNGRREIKDVPDNSAAEIYSRNSPFDIDEIKEVDRISRSGTKIEVEVASGEHLEKIKKHLMIKWETR